MKKKYSYDELLEMEKTTIPLTMRKLEGIVFGYANLNAGDEMLGGYGGFSFILYDTGIIEVREYVFPQILAKERFYQIPESCVSEIREVYLKYKDELDSLYAPDNGSCDGSISCFYFGNHWIDALNIDYADAPKIRCIRDAHPNDHEFEEIMKIVRIENKIMEIFFAVCSVFKQYKIILGQFSVTVEGKSTIKHSEFVCQ